MKPLFSFSQGADDDTSGATIMRKGPMKEAGVPPAGLFDEDDTTVSSMIESMEDSEEEGKSVNTSATTRTSQTTPKTPRQSSRKLPLSKRETSEKLPYSKRESPVSRKSPLPRIIIKIPTPQGKSNSSASKKSTKLSLETRRLIRSNRQFSADKQNTADRLFSRETRSPASDKTFSVNTTPSTSQRTLPPSHRPSSPSYRVSSISHHHRAGSPSHRASPPPQRWSKRHSTSINSLASSR